MQEKLKKFILLIKTYLPTSLIWQWHFSTDQSNLTFQNLVMACLQLRYLYVTQPCLHTLMQPCLSPNQSPRTILVILWNNNNAVFSWHIYFFAKFFILWGRLEKGRRNFHHSNPQWFSLATLWAVCVGTHKNKLSCNMWKISLFQLLWTQISGIIPQRFYQGISASQ